MNPFVGPQPFSASNTIYGRDLEISELRYFIGSKRIALLYSPSGAGKTSLIQAQNGLIAKLRESGRFDIWGPARVNSSPDGFSASNRFAWSAITEFEKSRPGGVRPAEVFASTTLAEYVKERAPESSPLLIFDQFEEVLRLDPVDTKTKREFFDQLGELLYDSGIWAIFVLREDYLAALQPYTRQVPTHLQNHFRIDFLRREDQALDAVTKPLLAQGRKFEAGVAESMLRDLATLHSESGDQVGDSVEPLQIQVVCSNLWKRIADKDPRVSIVAGDIGRISDALGAYYEERVQRDSVGLERQIRTWFDEKLITRDGARNLVRSEPKVTAGLVNEEIDKLVDSYLVRKEPRAGAMWFELSHDRMVEPVRSSNKEWFEQHLHKLQKDSALWERQDRFEGLLLSEADLPDAEAWAEQNAGLLTTVEQAFLKASQNLAAALRRERAQAKDLLNAQKARADAETQRADAERARAEAQTVSLRRARMLVGALVTIIVLAIGATILVNWRSRQAMASRLATNARVQALSDAKLGVWLAVYAGGLNQTKETLEALEFAMQKARRPLVETPGQSEVKAFAFAPDGTTLASGHQDKLVRLWNVANGINLKTDLEHPDFLTDVVFSPAGSILATASADGAVRLWNWKNNGSLARTFQGPSPANGISFSADGNLLAVGYSNGVIRIWRSSNGEQAAELPGDGQQVISVDFYPAGDRVLAGYADGAVRLWTLANKKADEIAREKDKVARVRVQPGTNGGLAVAVGQSALLIDGAKARRQVATDDLGVASVAFSADGKTLAVAGMTGAFAVFEAASGKEMLRVALDDSPLTSVGFAPPGDGNMLAVGSRDGTVRVYQLDSGKLLKQAHELLAKYTLLEKDCVRFLEGRTCELP